VSVYHSHHAIVVLQPAAAAAGQPMMRRWGGIPGLFGAGRIGRSWAWLLAFWGVSRGGF
jgi:hypothetical protein